MNRRGFSLVEVMIAIVVVAVALLPLFSSGGSIHRMSHLTEQQLLAKARSRALMSLVRSLDYTLLDRLIVAGGGVRVPIPLEEFLEDGAMPFLFSAGGADAYAAKLENMNQTIVGTRRGPHLIEIGIEIQWGIPGIRGPDRVITDARLLPRPEATFIRGGS